MKIKLILILSLSLLLSACQTDTEHSLQVPLFLATDTGPGAAIGTVTITQTHYGLLFTPDLTQLPPGVHGFHIHEHPNCAPGEHDHTQSAAFAAGGHFDPKKTGKHEGPYGNGHLGDLPVLYVDDQGVAQIPTLAPRLTHLKQIKNRALMIHIGGDNYSDLPQPLGGGGARMACGLI